MKRFLLLTRVLGLLACLVLIAAGARGDGMVPPADDGADLPAITCSPVPEPTPSPKYTVYRFPFSTPTKRPAGPTRTPIPTPEPTPTPVPPPVQRFDGGNKDGYVIILDDAADLLTPEEEQRVQEAMRGLTEYGDVVFWTTREKSYDASLLRLQQYVDREISSSVDHPSASFFIDMAGREFCILTRGELMRTVDSAEVNAILDRTRPYASSGEYAECAIQTFNSIDLQ